MKGYALNAESKWVETINLQAIEATMLEIKAYMDQLSGQMEDDNLSIEEFDQKLAQFNSMLNYWNKNETALSRERIVRRTKEVVNALNWPPVEEA